MKQKSKNKKLWLPKDNCGQIVIDWKNPELKKRLEEFCKPYIIKPK